MPSSRQEGHTYLLRSFEDGIHYIEYLGDRMSGEGGIQMTESL